MKDSKEVTIYDIAKELQVSPATVSRSLNNNPSVSKKTRKKIMDTAKAMGYRSNLFASNLRRQRTNTLGVIVPKLNSNFVSSVVAGIEKVANQHGYNLIISQSQESEKKETSSVTTMFNSRVDGLIVSLASDTKGLTHFNSFFNKDIPVMFFDRVFYENATTNVVIDNLKAGYQATMHLIEQGCKRIAHITGNLSSNVYSDRLKGYKLALSEKNIPFRSKYLIVNRLDETGSVQAAEQLLAMNPMPDGIFITNDNCAAICMQALKEAGFRIPQDIAIVGFNNDLIGRIIEPKLTTIDYPGQEMGEIVAHNMVNLLEGTASATMTNTIIIRSDLIIRQSSLKSGNVSKKKL